MGIKENNSQSAMELRDFAFSRSYGTPSERGWVKISPLSTPPWMEEEVMVSDLEYETTGIIGPNCIIADLKTIAPWSLLKKGWGGVVGYKTDAEEIVPGGRMSVPVA
jgi:hypothetical protein